jgi:hypothetical protein
MTSIFLTTFLSCSKVLQVANRLQQVIGLNYHQKMEIVNELNKVVPSCPVIIDNNDRTTTIRD